MATVRSVLVLIVAVLISGQMLMLMERGRSIRKRLRDLGWGGRRILIAVRPRSSVERLACC